MKKAYTVRDVRVRIALFKANKKTEAKGNELETRVAAIMGMSPIAFRMIDGNEVLGMAAETALKEYLNPCGLIPCTFLDVRLRHKSLFAQGRIEESWELFKTIAEAQRALQQWIEYIGPDEHILTADAERILLKTWEKEDLWHTY